MKIILLISFFYLPLHVAAQNHWELTATRERLYREIKDFPGIQELGYFEGIGEEREYWKKADSLFKAMPLKFALNYYYDSSYSIRYYSFLKVLGINDTLALNLLSEYIFDSTKVLIQVDDTGGEINFNTLLLREYEVFIDLKYHWCDSKGTLYRKYFKPKPFQFSKMNYAKWPQVLTSFIKRAEQWNINHSLSLDDLKYYRGVKYFYGR